LLRGACHRAPGELDNTVGPAAIFQKGCSAQQGENLAPCFGLQFFGRVDIDGQSGIMTVTLKDVGDRALWSVDIEPRPDARPGRILAQHPIVQVGMHVGDDGAARLEAVDP